MWIRRKAVQDVNKENIDTSVHMDNLIDFQNDDISAPVTPKSASFQKLENMKSPVKEKFSGYRIIDMKILWNVFSMLLCLLSQCETLVLHEDSSKKYGLYSSLYLKCMKCGYKNDFFTSEKVGRNFEINQRIVCSMRSLDKAIKV